MPTTATSALRKERARREAFMQCAAITDTLAKIFNNKKLPLDIREKAQDACVAVIYMREHLKITDAQKAGIQG